MTSPAQHAATVREALWPLAHSEHGARGLAALDALQAQAEAALDREAGTSDALDEMRAERDRLAAQVTELETALREIDNEDLTDELAAAEFKRVARAALDKDTQ